MENTLFTHIYNLLLWNDIFFFVIIGILLRILGRIHSNLLETKTRLQAPTYIFRYMTRHMKTADHAFPDNFTRNLMKIDHVSAHSD